MMRTETDVRAALAQGPRVVEGLVAAAPKEALTWREADGAWNVVEVLSHLADGEITDWMPRVERILSGGGRFIPYDREGGFSRYRGWTAEALVGEFGQLRRANLDKLDTLQLSAPHLALQGEHPEFGPVTLRQLLATWVAHDLGHIAQTARVMAKQYREAIGPWRAYLPVMDR